MEIPLRPRVGIRKRAEDLLGKLGPGIISGASRNDPSSITTYAVIGAKTGYSLLWTLLISLPLLAAVQDISARVGRVTGGGISENLRRYYSRWLLYSVTLLLVVANTINLGADIEMMGQAVTLLVGGPPLVFAAALTILSVSLQILMSYQRYVGILKWLTLALLAYVAAAVVVRIDWTQAWRGLLIPAVSSDPAYPAAVLAAFGATINPYLLFWQASQEVEEQDRHPTEVPLRVAPHQAPVQIGRIMFDTYTGMAYSNLVAFAIMLTTAATLHSHGIKDIRSASEAAGTLTPIAGDFAGFLFSLGIIGTGLLAIPVLAGSMAYAIGEAMNWEARLECDPFRCRGFYSVLAAAALVGLSLTFLGVNPVKALYWTAIINGVISAPMMAVLLLMASNRSVMGSETIPIGLRLLGWIAAGVVFAASAGLFVSWLR